MPLVGTPLAYYDFLEGSGTTLTDRQSATYNGTLGPGANAPTWVAGQGLRFDGTNDYVALAPSLYTAGVKAVQVALTVAPTTNPQPLIAPNTGQWMSLAAIDGSPRWGGDEVNTHTDATERREGTHLLTFNFGSPNRIYWNAAESVGYQGQATDAPLTSAPTNLNLGNLPGAGLWLNGTVYYLVFYASALTAQNVSDNYTFISSQLASRSITLGTDTIPATRPVVFLKGDSQTACFSIPVASQRWTTLVTSALGGQAAVNLTISGASGQFLSGMQTNLATEVVGVLNKYPNAICTVVLWGGTNDLAGAAAGAGTTVWNTYSAVATTLRNLGPRVRVVGVPIMDRTDGGANYHGNRNTFNASLLAAPRSLISAVARIDQSPNIGGDGAYSNTSFFAVDGIHLNSGGATDAAPYFTTAINTALSGVPLLPQLLSLRPMTGTY